MKPLQLFILFLLCLGLLTQTFGLDENPPFLDNSVYSSRQSAVAALEGIYQSLTTYGAQEQRLFAINGFSGHFVTRRNESNNVNNVNLFSLSPIQDRDSGNMWRGLYQTAARANSAIASTSVTDNAVTSDELLFNDIAGHAYFIRAYAYFSLVRLWEDIPLWLELPSSGNTDKAKSSAKDVYAQIISDAQRAAELMNGTAGSGFPRAEAANMLLAKVYMTMATAPQDLRVEPLADAAYWQLAYTEARKIYGQYSLTSDYASLFTVASENSSESIFELQISQDAANSQMARNFTPFKWKLAQYFGWFSIHADFYNHHVATYPEDPRLAATYLYEYDQADNGATVRVYPANAGRSAFGNSHPYFFKYAEKDRSSTNQYGSQNIVVYRYAEALLMLAEISNELQNGEQLGYVTEVLDRVGLTPQAGFQGDRAAFLDALMDEYRFELLGEGEDAYGYTLE
jgi:hypothetical protein